MTTNLQEIQSLAADTVELCIFIEDGGVAKTITEKDFHNSLCKSGGRRISNGFHAGKTAHSAAADEVHV